MQYQTRTCNRSRNDTWKTPNSLASIRPWKDLPEPRAPKIRILGGGGFRGSFLGKYSVGLSKNLPRLSVDLKK